MSKFLVGSAPGCVENQAPLKFSFRGVFYVFESRIGSANPNQNHLFLWNKNKIAPEVRNIRTTRIQNAHSFSIPGSPATFIPMSPVRKDSGKNIAATIESTNIRAFCSCATMPRNSSWATMARSRMRSKSSMTI